MESCAATGLQILENKVEERTKKRHTLRYALADTEWNCGRVLICVYDDRKYSDVCADCAGVTGST